MFAGTRTFTCAVSMFAAFSVQAQAVDDKTKCAVAGQIMDAPSPDMHKVSELFRYILVAMQNVDRSYGINGKVEILPRMTEDGLRSTVAAVSVRCRESPNTTIRDMAAETYEGIRAIQNSLDVEGMPKLPRGEERAEALTTAISSMLNNPAISGHGIAIENSEDARYNHSITVQFTGTEGDLVDKQVLASAEVALRIGYLSPRQEATTTRKRPHNKDGSSEKE